MYNSPNVPVDKGLGFDFSQISDLVKGVTAVGLNIFNKQMDIKQVKAMGQVNAGLIPNAGQYGQYSTGLPVSPVYGFQPNVPQPYQPQPTSMFDTSTIMLGGLLIVGGLVLFKVLRG